MLALYATRSLHTLLAASTALALWLGMLAGCIDARSGDAARAWTKAPARPVPMWEPVARSSVTESTSAADDAGPAQVDAGKPIRRSTPVGAGSVAVDAVAGSLAPRAAAGVNGGAGSVALAGSGAGAGGEGQADPPIDPACTRENLQQVADAYFAALSSGDSSELKLHPSLRYTENGLEQALPFENFWLTRPRAQFKRHVLDEPRCSSLTEAVLNNAGTRYIVAVRLRQLLGQLAEIEVHVVPRNYTDYDPEAIVVTGTDDWLQPVAAGSRMNAESLVRMAEAYFDPVLKPDARPPLAPGCVFRLNGVKIGADASCRLPPDTARYEGLRYPVVDVVTGVVTAIGLSGNSLFAFFFRVRDGALQQVESVGGATSQTTGW